MSRQPPPPKDSGLEAEVLPSPFALPAYGARPAQRGAAQGQQQQQQRHPVVALPGGLEVCDGYDTLVLDDYSALSRFFGILSLLIAFIIAVSLIGSVLAGSGAGLLIGLLGPAVFGGAGTFMLYTLTRETVVFDRRTEQVSVAREAFLPCRAGASETYGFCDLAAMGCVVHRRPRSSYASFVTLDLSFAGMAGNGAAVRLVSREANGLEDSLQLEWAAYFATLHGGPTGAGVVRAGVAMAAEVAEQGGAPAAQVVVDAGGSDEKYVRKKKYNFGPTASGAFERSASSSRYDDE
jgi:hypothetical protein